MWLKNILDRNGKRYKMNFNLYELALEKCKNNEEMWVKITGPTRTFTIMKLVAQAFDIKPTANNDKFIYHIDGDLSNDYASNLTYDITQTEQYIKEQEEIKNEQIRLAQEKLEKEAHKKELINYIENNKVFLQQTKEINKEVTLNDVYDKLCEILEVLKNGQRN